MSEEISTDVTTQHAFLVIWGNYAQEIGLIAKLTAVPIAQRSRDHTPHTKVLEFLLAILSGTPQLQDISRAAHPLSKDQAVATAWQQPGWADYSGVSRTLQRLDAATVAAINRVFEEVSQPWLEAEVQRQLTTTGRLIYDGDLTGVPVSDTSTSYPDARYGYMATEVRLGYQAALVSLSSTTYGRLWLAVDHHPGDTVSATQAVALVLAAEARTGRRPRRRTELVAQRLQGYYAQIAELSVTLTQQEHMLQDRTAKLQHLRDQERGRAQEVATLTTHYAEQPHSERPTSRLAQARQRLATTQSQQQRQIQGLHKTQQRLTKLRAQRAQLQHELVTLQQWLEDLERDNATNPAPIHAEFRSDAGFGTGANLTWLIEMGYEVYTKPHGGKLTPQLQREVQVGSVWTRVGANAEMVAWAQRPLKHCPYPLDVALERFYAGQQLKHSALLHYGDDPVTVDLPAWFQHYNGRQTIEAGIKETKQVFYLQRIKVRTLPAIYLQECATVFAANFIRFAQQWAVTHALPTEKPLALATLGIKRQVRVGTQVSAWVRHDSDSWLLTFTPQSCFAGQTLRLPAPRAASGAGV